MQAATRGDGREGEDVTHNLSTRGAVHGLPVAVAASAGDRAMPAEFEVRGEIYITSSDFEKVSWASAGGGVHTGEGGCQRSWMCERVSAGQYLSLRGGT